jgi:hypothetical protein
MSPEERAFCERIHKQAMEILGVCGNIEIDAGGKETKQGRRARRAQEMAAALATEASARIRDAEMKADQEQPERFDLAALGALPMTAPELGALEGGE